MEETISRILSSIRLAEPQDHGPMTVLPVFADMGRGPRYTTLAEALSKHALVVTEVGEEGQVPNLLAKNTGKHPVLVLDGEELAGAKQNRVLNTTILIGVGREVLIPVSCTEQGRWSRVSREFAHSGHISPHRMRRGVQASVHETLRSGAAYAGNQGAVWSDVRTMAEERGVDAPTGALRDVVENQRASLADFEAAFTLADGQCGLLAMVAGKVVGLDLVSRPEAYAKLHANLVASYAMDAVIVSTTEKNDPEEAKRFVVELGSLAGEEYEAPGLGTSVRYESGDVVGSALVYRKTPLHAAFFPSDDAAATSRMTRAAARRAYRG